MTPTPNPAPRFEFAGGDVALDFANTVSNYLSSAWKEKFDHYDKLVAWAEQAGLLPAAEAQRLRREAAHRPDEAARVLAEAVALRAAIFGAFFAGTQGRPVEPEHLATISGAFRRAQAHQSLVATPEGGFRAAWDPPGDSLDGPLWPVAGAAAALLTGAARERVRLCASNDCTWLFVDHSKNGSRRWCTMKDCGNRAKARRHYTRRKQEQDDAG